MDDYTFLEDMGRKVESWGKEIVQGGYMAGTSSDRRRGGGRGRGDRGRGRGRGGGSSVGPGKTKRDILKVQLQARDIEMETLSVGMDRRKSNQSTWDSRYISFKPFNQSEHCLIVFRRNQTALLTIELKFHKPKDPAAPSSALREPPFTMLTHKNNMKSPLLSIIRSHIHEQNISKKDSTYPEWVKRLVYPDPDDPESFSNPQCVMAAHLDPLVNRHSRIKTASYSLDPSQPLAKVLCHTEFVEFPTIEIWDDFPGTILDAEGIIRHRQEGAAKRRKLNPKAGKATIDGLLGDYGSDDEDKNEGTPKSANVLAMLGNYVDSDDEHFSADGTKEENAEMEDVNLNGSDDDEDVQVDPVVILELLQAAGGADTVALDGQDALDWADVGGAELE